VKTTCTLGLALIAFTCSAGQAPAQIAFTFGRVGVAISPWQRVGVVAGYVPPPVYIPPAIGVVANPYVPAPPFVPPVMTLSPTIYAPTYLSLLTPGYQTIMAYNTAFYYYPALPFGATFVQVRGAPYYFAGGIWYQPYLTGAQTIYLVAPPPQ
jgi:hypothetical protein